MTVLSAELIVFDVHEGDRQIADAIDRDAAVLVAAIHSGRDAAFVRAYLNDAVPATVEGATACATVTISCRVNPDALNDELQRIGSEVQTLAERLGLPDPGAAFTADLIREMWAIVHKHDAAQPAGVDEGRAMGWYA